jgi:hypothetical protein
MRTWTLLAAALAATACSGPPAAEPPSTTAGAAAVDDFLTAYQRSREATFVLEQTYTRSVDGEPALTYPMRIVQRPPDDRLTVGGGNASGKLDGNVVRCASEPSGTSSCADGGPAREDGDVVAGELDGLRRLLTGDAAYSVARRDDGCFVLTLDYVYPAPPYGVSSTFCFDPDSGAPMEVRIDHGDGVVDDTVTTTVRTEVGPADLRVGDLGSLPEPS